MIKILTPGVMTYREGLDFQIKEKARVLNGESDGTVIILQHNPPVITIGRRRNTESVSSSDETIKREGFTIEYVSRAGDVTVHEPGQVVVYFILPVKSKDVKSFVDSIMVPLTEYFIRQYKLDFEFRENMPGLWIDNRKICSMGFDLTEGVSMHGIAINVNNSLKGFDMVVPCGIRGVEMTSLSREIGKEIDMKKFILDLKDYFICQHH